MANVKILFAGRKLVATRCLEYLLTRENVEIIGVLTDSHLEISPTKNLAVSSGIPIYSFDAALERIGSGKLDFDLGLSVLYWRKLRDGFLTSPVRGFLNFHPAILPEYKGTAGYNLAILESLDSWGVSAHYVDGSIDTGPIIDVAKFPISLNEETAKSLEQKSVEALYEQFKKIVDLALAAEQMLPTKANIGGRYVTRQEMEEMKEVKEGDDVHRKIRAFWFPPYHGAYKVVNGVKCTLIDDFILQQLADPSVSSLFTKQHKDA